MDPYHKPLNDDEFELLGELLAKLDEYDGCSMEPDYLDGYLTALIVSPEEIKVSEWMPYVFDEQGNMDVLARVCEGESDGEAMCDELEDLVFRRFNSLEDALARGDKLDPVIYDVEDDHGRPLGGYDAIAALNAFAEGFLECMNRWPQLQHLNNEFINSALLGILRHLPEEQRGDLASIISDLELESPLSNLNEALDDLALSVAEIASITRKFRMREIRSSH